MSNTVLLIVFFGMLGLIFLLAPKLIYVLYKEITQLGSESTSGGHGHVASAGQLGAIRIIGVGVLAVVGRVYYF